MSNTKEFIQFLEASPTAWHAVDWLKNVLVKEGFEVLLENQPWKLEWGKSYVVIHQGSSLCAFVLPASSLEFLKIIGAHTDSPALKLKPHAEFTRENMVMLGVDIYGAPLLTSWLNRDLGIAGKIIYKDLYNKIQETLINLTEDPVILPQLAIHLDRNVNENGLTLHKQDHLAVLASLKNTSFPYLESLIRKQIPFQTLLGSDLFVYPLEQPRSIGSQQQLLSAYRIDNLASVHAGLMALLQSKQPLADTLKMAVFWDHEEIGSNTSQGAASPFLPQTIERLCCSLKLSREHYLRILSQGFCISVDMTHASHPNYPEKSEPRHVILMDKGIAIKSNAQKRYASEALSSSKIVDICQQHQIPYQFFVGRGDIPSGSTIGPIHAALTGMETVDIGIPQLSMHSCRELCAWEDYHAMNLLLAKFLSH